MGKYSKFERKEVAAPYKIHPIWRAFGLVIAILLPIMSGAAAWELINGMGAGMPYISQMHGNLQVPATITSLPFISNIAWWLASIPNFPALAIFFVIILIFLSGIMSMVYSMIYRLIGPPRYTPLDAPAPRTVSVKKYKR